MDSSLEVAHSSYSLFGIQERQGGPGSEGGHVPSPTVAPVIVVVRIELLYVHSIVQFRPLTLPLVLQHRRVARLYKQTHSKLFTEHFHHTLS